MSRVTGTRAHRCLTLATRLRFNLTDGPELRCAHCGEWWGLTPDHWRSDNWTRCIPCSNERSRLWQELRRKDPDFRDLQVARTRRYRKWLRRKHPDLLNAYERERRAIARQKAIDYRARQAAA